MFLAPKKLLELQNFLGPQKSFDILGPKISCFQKKVCYNYIFGANIFRLTNILGGGPLPFWVELILTHSFHFGSNSML